MENKNNRTAIRTPSPSQGKSSVDRGSEMMRCLALVRPVGMGDDMASDWLAVALVEVRHLSDRAFLAGTAHARATCTHHGQIIPAIIGQARETEKPNMADMFLAHWNLAAGQSVLADERGQTARIGDVIKRIECE